MPVNLRDLHWAITRDEGVRYASYRKGTHQSSPLQLQVYDRLSDGKPDEIGIELYFDAVGSNRGAPLLWFCNCEIAEGTLIDHELYIPSQELTIALLRRTFESVPIILRDTNKIRYENGFFTFRD